MILIFLLAACGPKAPPASIYPLELPPLEPPAVAEVVPAQDEIPAVAPFLPGQRPPFTDAACLATGRGLVVPEAKAVELYQAAELGDWWEAKARACMDARATDRAYCDGVVGRQVLELEAAERETRWARWAIPVGVTVGVFLGAGATGLAYQVGTP